MKRFVEALRKVCARFVELCRDMGLLAAASVAIDGSKFKAVNNRDRNFTKGNLVTQAALLSENSFSANARGAMAWRRHEDYPRTHHCYRENSIRYHHDGGMNRGEDPVPRHPEDRTTENASSSHKADCWLRYNESVMSCETGVSRLAPRTPKKASFAGPRTSTPSWYLSLQDTLASLASPYISLTDPGSCRLAALQLGLPCGRKKGIDVCCSKVRLLC